MISDILGVSGRAMIARNRMRTEIGVLEEAPSGYFTDRPAFLTRTMLDRIDRLGVDVDRVEAAIEETSTPSPR